MTTRETTHSRLKEQRRTECMGGCKRYIFNRLLHFSSFLLLLLHRSALDKTQGHVTAEINAPNFKSSKSSQVKSSSMIIISMLYPNVSPTSQQVNTSSQSVSRLINGGWLASKFTKVWHCMARGLAVVCALKCSVYMLKKSLVILVEMPLLCVCVCVCACVRACVCVRAQFSQ